MKMKTYAVARSHDETIKLLNDMQDLNEVLITIFEYSDDIKVLQELKRKNYLHVVFMRCIQLDNYINFSHAIKKLWNKIPHSFFNLTIDDLEYIIKHNDNDNILPIAQDILLELEYMYLNYDRQ